MANDDVTHINTTPDNASMPPQYRLEETCFASAIEQTQEKKREGKKKKDFVGLFIKINDWPINTENDDKRKRVIIIIHHSSLFLYGKTNIDKGLTVTLYSS